MGWISKRTVKVSRNGEMVTLPPGSDVPEAAGWRNPTMWCTWYPDVVPAEEKETPSNPETGNNGGDEEPDYNAMNIKELRKLAKEAQKITKDDSTDVKKANKEELIVIIKSVKG